MRDVPPFPLSVCVFFNSQVRGGAEQYALELLRGMSRDLFRFVVVAPEVLLNQLQPDLPADVETVPLTFMTPAQLGAAAQFARVLRERRVQIVHSHQFRASLVASPVAKFCGVPVTVETPHVREFWRRGWKANYAVDRLAGRAVDAYVAVSQANRNYLVETKRLPAAKMHVIPGGCDVQRFVPGIASDAAMRASLNIGEDDPVLLVVGRLEEQKGHAVLLSAMPAILAACPAAKLVCVGDGSLRGKLSDLAERLGIAAGVRFVGTQQDLPRWYALADIVVLPSWFEGLPLTAVEALACGKPVVATAVDGTPEVIVDGECGLTVPPGDAEELAHAVVRLLRDAELRARYGGTGRSALEKNYTTRHMVERHERLYLDLWQARTGTPLQARRAEAGT